MTHQQSAHARQHLTACPLCDVQFGPDKSESRRQGHIFKHMETIGLFSLPSHLRDTSDEDHPLSSTSNSRFEDLATGLIRSEEAKSAEYRAWAQLKEQKVEGYDDLNISQWVEGRVERTEERRNMTVCIIFRGPNGG